MKFDSRYIYIILAIIIFASIMSGSFSLLAVLFSVPGVLLAITFHEYAHALVAYKLGDDTPKVQGRLSLNPFTHLDPVAVVLLMFTHIGWGKPVEINPNNFNKKISAKTGEALVAAAGPVMNFLLAIVLTLVTCALDLFATNFVSFSKIGFIIYIILKYAITVNIGLGVFNLIPLPPLDGSKVLMAFLTYNAKRWFEDHENIFYIVFLIIWITPIAGEIVSPIINAINTGITNMIYGLFSIFM